MPTPWRTSCTRWASSSTCSRPTCTPSRARRTICSRTSSRATPCPPPCATRAFPRSSATCACACWPPSPTPACPTPRPCARRWKPCCGGRAGILAGRGPCATAGDRTNSPRNCPATRPMHGCEHGRAEDPGGASRPPWPPPPCPYPRPPPPHPPPPPPLAPADPPPAPRVPRDRRRRVWAGVAGACLVVGMAWVWSQRETEPAPPSGLFVWDPMPWATSIHEVAPPWKPPEADPGAAPSRVETPAPVTTVTLRTDTLPMKKARSPRAASVLLAMTAAANTACPAAQVRRNPPSEECPAGAVKTMTETLGLKMGDIHYASLPGFEPSTHHPVPVREGPISLELSSDWDVGASRLNAMDGRTVFPDRSTLSGQLFLGKERVYGRITQVVTPKGAAFTVCMDLVSEYYERGLEYETPGANAKVRPMGKVKIVKRFE